MVWLLVATETRASFLTITAIISLVASIILFKRMRVLSDTATTTLRTVTQGYVEMVGTAMTFPGETGPAPRELPPTVWFRLPESKSSAGFLVIDEYGSCTVDPQKAEVISPLLYRFGYLFRAIHPGETVYLLGQLTTITTHYTDADTRQATLSLLSEWKRDHVSMIQRFDHNGDGKIDQQELMVARQHAQEAVENTSDETYRGEAEHILEKTDDGRPFIISNIPPEKLIARYQFWMIAHLVAWPVLSMLAWMVRLH
ncbi:EF-hand domain-containing protein [Leucothrix sargassi]|nr:EF-hand domain-containing protein [Leucothrix sargassi]